MANQWFKFYGGEFLSDSKIENLSAQERSCWLTLLCLASMSGKPGVIKFLTVETLLKKSGIEWDPYNSQEWDRCLGVLKKFERLEMIKLDDDGTITVLNWTKRQETAMSGYERLKKYRENKAKTDIDNNMITDDNATDNGRIEENRIEENIYNTKRSNKFVAPTLEGVKAYCKERNNKVDPDNFVNFYDSKGWMIGKNKMKSWQAAVRTWEKSRNSGTSSTPPPKNVLHSVDLGDRISRITNKTQK